MEGVARPQNFPPRLNTSEDIIAWLLRKPRPFPASHRWLHASADGQNRGARLRAIGLFGVFLFHFPESLRAISTGLKEKPRVSGAVQPAPQAPGTFA